MNINEAIQYLLDHSYSVEILDEASESDAYRRTKAKLDELPEELKEEIIADAKDKNHWQRECYNELLSTFGLRNTEALYYTPGLARIAYGELDFEGEEEDSRAINLLRRYVHFITTAHKDDFDRYLNFKGPDGIKECSFEDLDNMFGAVASNSIKDEYNAIADKKYKNTGYEIIWLKDFETAEQYCDYTEPNTWCYLEDESTFEMYTNNGMTKLYLALKPGFENMKPGDPGYGQSMLGIDVNPGDNGLPAELIHVSNRYNHAEDPELDSSKNPAGDNRFNATELSEILGGPFWEICPPYTDKELHDKHIYLAKDLPGILKDILSVDEEPSEKDNTMSNRNVYALEKYGFMYKTHEITLNDEHTILQVLANVKSHYSMHIFDKDNNLIEYNAQTIKFIRDVDNKITILEVIDNDYTSSLYTIENNNLIKLVNKCSIQGSTTGRLIIYKDPTGYVNILNKANFTQVKLPERTLYIHQCRIIKDQLIIVKVDEHRATEKRLYVYYFDTMEELDVGDAYNYIVFQEYDLIEFLSDTGIKLYNTNYDEFLPIVDNAEDINIYGGGKYFVTYGSDKKYTVYKYRYNSNSVEILYDNLKCFGQYNDFSNRYFIYDRHNKEYTLDANFNIMEKDY